MGGSACTTGNNSMEEQPDEKIVHAAESPVFKPHQEINQEPIPVKVERISENEVNIEMTSQITDIEITKYFSINRWMAGEGFLHSS